MAVSGPVTAPVSGMVTGRWCTTPRTTARWSRSRVASRSTASPFWDDVQLKPPVIVPGLAMKPMVGVIPGTRVSTDRQRATEPWPSGGESTLPVAPQGGVPVTSVTMPQNLALMSETVADPAFSAPPVAVPTSPSW